MPNITGPAQGAGEGVLGEPRGQVRELKAPSCWRTIGCSLHSSRFSGRQLYRTIAHNVTHNSLNLKRTNNHQHHQHPHLGGEGPDVGDEELLRLLLLHVLELQLRQPVQSGVRICLVGPVSICLVGVVRFVWMPHLSLGNCAAPWLTTCCTSSTVSPRPFLSCTWGGV